MVKSFRRDMTNDSVFDWRADGCEWCGREVASWVESYG